MSLIPVGAIASAASYLSREWGENRTMGPGEFLGSWESDEGLTQIAVYAFECGASDGSRWFIVSDRYGNRAHGDTVGEALARFNRD